MRVEIITVELFWTPQLYLGVNKLYFPIDIIEKLFCPYNHPAWVDIVNNTQMKCMAPKRDELDALT